MFYFDCRLIFSVSKYTNMTTAAAIRYSKMASIRRRGGFCR